MIPHRNYLICYDIKEKKRLARVARYVEKEAFRIQKSIYLLPNATTEALQLIAKEIQKRIDTQEDDVRIYTIKHSGYTSGIAINLDEPFIFV